MIMNFVIAGVILAIGYTWCARGFFSALLHFACVLVAGAVAFSLWEPLAYMILENAGGSQWIIDAAWAAALAVPFGVVLIILRKTLDLLIPWNADLDTIGNLIGGLVCGAGSAFISAGILVLTLTHLRWDPSFLGYQPIESEGSGALVRRSSLWIPVDRWTVAFYEYLSDRTLATATPMSRWRPDLVDDGPLLEISFNEGSSKLTMEPKSFLLAGRYTINKDGSPEKLDDLLAHKDDKKKQTVVTIDGETIPGGSSNMYIEGFVVEFRAAAREKEGRIVVGNAQVRLICEKKDGTESISIQPVAIISAAEMEEGKKQVEYGRWRFTSGNTFIASVGGADNPKFAFEFPVPRGYKPLALQVKGLRADIEKVAVSGDYEDGAARDKEVKDRSLIEKAGTPRKAIGGPKKDGPWLYPKGLVNLNLGDGRDFANPIRINPTIGDRKMLSKDGLKGLEVNDANEVINGEEKYTTEEMSGNRGIDQKLIIRKFAATDDTIIVQVDISESSKLSLVRNEAAANAKGAPRLVDSLGQIYTPVGFTYEDKQMLHIRFLPGEPLTDVKDLPFGGPSTSRPDQKFTLLYRVSTNVKLEAFVIGDTVVGKINPALLIK